jgi:hypothetical protein
MTLDSGKFFRYQPLKLDAYFLGKEAKHKPESA